eukprot:CAMPEP_0197024522 /NCGR_PEP_ID=MMETSP1384-20130603/5050_1 /TAXON_ID=29189 /ORGANISM="Ammonia sp." /LENGTH=489 /DNA_ID=CAMNT_0042452919 /DNA_START=131 /DNA_END=1600 /DNA_ORIENTATION=-
MFEAVAGVLLFGIAVGLSIYSKSLLLALWKTDKVVAYGIYSTLTEMIFCHFWFLFRALFVGKRRRRILTEQIKTKFLKIINKDDESSAQDNNVVITHSCRTIFYCIIKSLLDATHTNNGEEKRIKICGASIQFGSFYRLLRSIELAEKCKIEHYEIDVSLTDFTLNTASIDEEEVSQCDLILCMHLFGVPFEQNVLFELGRKYDIPILEDCVQSGSLFGTYKGHKLADASIWSCGLDKTPSCFGGGLGYFSNSKHGQRLYEQVTNLVDTFEIDTLRDRGVSLLNQSVHLVIARNHFFFDAIAMAIAYFVYYQNEEIVPWFDLALKVRKNKSITPFQHQSSLFLTKPSIAQLYSIRYGLRKNYNVVILNEIQKRDLLLNNIPKRYHAALFPWMTDKALKAYHENKGIGEFSWVFSKSGDRIELNEFLCRRYIITLINTTWVHHQQSSLKHNNAHMICENLTYLPNLNECNETQILKLAKALTAYAEFKKF